MNWGTDLCETALAIALAADSQGIEASRVEVAGPVVDVRRHLHAKQRECFDEIFVHGAQAIDILGARQGGKTFLDTAILLQCGIDRPGTTNPYFGLTGESIDDIWWPEVVAWWQLLGYPMTSLSKAERTAAIPGTGSMLKGYGTNNVAYIETKRGTKYGGLALDECGAQRDAVLRYFLELVRPTLARHRAPMVRSGNPGRVLDGWWYLETNPNRTATAPLFKFTAWDNPAMGSAEDLDAYVSAQIYDSCGMTLEQIRTILEHSDDEATELDRASQRKSGPVVSFLREWLAQWGIDASTLVYPFDLARNGVDALPTHNGLGSLLDVKQWRYTAVCDPAGKGYTGFALFASHPGIRRRFIVSSSKHKGMLLGEAANRLRGYRRDHPRCRLGLDAGGLGSVHSQQFAREFALYVEDAEKTEKASAIDFFRNNLIAGMIGVLNGECNDAWRGEAAACGWDKRRLLHDPDAEDHCLDSADYCERLDRTRPQTEQDDTPAAPKTGVEIAALARAARAKQLARAAQGRQWR